MMTSERFERRAGWAGIVFFVVFAAGAVLGAVVGNSGDTRAEVVAAYGDGGDNLMRELSAFLLTLALIPFVPFVIGLCSRVGGRDGEERGLSIVALVGGVLMAGFLALTNVLSVAVPASEESLNDYVVNADVAQTFEVASWWSLNFISVAGTLLVGATALAARRTGALPRWLAVTGIAVAVIGLAGFFTWGLSILLEILWLLAASIVLARTSPATAAVRQPALGSA